jgi:hypothetical protein
LSGEFPAKPPALLRWQYSNVEHMSRPGVRVRHRPAGITVEADNVPALQQVLHNICLGVVVLLDVPNFLLIGFFTELDRLSCVDQIQNLSH